MTSSALSPQTWLFGLEWLPASACLVGGSVRDALLGRVGDYLDLDFVLPEGAVATAQAIAHHYKAGYVLLDAERHIARVVFERGTADFAEQVGNSLEEDLQRRDFTVNAIAYDPHCDRVIDPLQGCRDLQQRTLRMVSPANLAEDPLRLLRAYRQAAQLGFNVEPATRQEIRRLAPLLGQIAAERIQSEINYLISTDRGTFWLQAAWEDGLLQDWFAHATAADMALVAAVDRTARVLQETLPDFYQMLISPLRQVSKPDASAASGGGRPKGEGPASGATRNWLTLARLTCLLGSDVTAAEVQLRRLKYSRNEIQAVTTILRYLPQLQQAVRNEAITEVPQLLLSLREQCLFFQAVGHTFPAVAALAIARGTPLEAIAPMLKRYPNFNDPVAHPQPVLTGQALMKELNLPPGPRIGQLLAELQLARAEGRIHTAADALSYAAKLVESESGAKN